MSKREFIFECMDEQAGEDLAKQYPQAELVRCRDCKYSEQRTLEKCWCFNHAISMDMTGFCSEGAREDIQWPKM